MDRNECIMRSLSVPNDRNKHEKIVQKTGSLLSCKNLKKKYGTTLGLDDFTVDFTPGIYGILGPNGSGKSTFMNLLTDNMSRSGGEILFEGEEIKTMGARYRRQVGYMPQQQGFFPELTAMGFLRYMADLKGISRHESKKICGELIQKFDLQEYKNRPIGAYSVGMRQRVLLAQAILGDPVLLLLDEPTAGLDPRERIRVRNIISQLRENKIILLATHIVSDVELIADQIILMKEGRIRKIGTPEQLERGIRDKVRLYPEELLKNQMLSENVRIGNEARRDGKNWIRLIGDDLPEGGMETDGITLDDVYLYYVDTEQ